LQTATRGKAESRKLKLNAETPTAKAEIGKQKVEMGQRPPGQRGFISRAGGFVQENAGSVQGKEPTAHANVDPFPALGKASALSRARVKETLI
jgi:hypothetical protein